MADPIQFDRKPYFVSWKDENGDMKRIRRVPPPKLHEALPEDIVKLTKQRNDDFKTGDTVAVKHINPRHPNVLQLVNDSGQTTFVDYYNMEVTEKRALRDGMRPEELPERNKYLRWP